MTLTRVTEKTVRFWKLPYGTNTWWSINYKLGSWTYWISG